MVELVIPSLAELTVSTSAFPSVEPRHEEQVRHLPPHHVILENDDYHTFDFVITVLCKVLTIDVQRAFTFAKLAHDTGQAVVWTGAKEVAELKAEQIQSFHETLASGRKLGPLGVRVEPAPG